MSRIQHVLPVAALVVFELGALAVVGSAEGGELRFDREVSLQYDFSGGKQTPVWSGGSVLALEGNHSAAPQILKFGKTGVPDARFPVMVPGSTNVQVKGWAQGANGVLVICGSAYDTSGRESGFLVVFGEESGTSTVVRLSPYDPFRVVVASDGTIWTTGLEMIDGEESGPGISPDHGVLKHFDASGIFIASYLPRSSIPSNDFLTFGELVAGEGRIGWYTGPSHGPGSRYYEITESGQIREFPSVSLGQKSRVSGLGLGGNERAYISTFDGDTKVSQIKSIMPGEPSWRTEPLPAELSKAKFFKVYGTAPDALAVWREQPSNVAFVRTPSR